MPETEFECSLTEDQYTQFSGRIASLDWRQSVLSRVRANPHFPRRAVITGPMTLEFTGSPLWPSQVVEVVKSIGAEIVESIEEAGDYGHS